MVDDKISPGLENISRKGVYSVLMSISLRQLNSKLDLLI